MIIYIGKKGLNQVVVHKKNKIYVFVVWVCKGYSIVKKPALNVIIKLSVKNIIIFLVYTYRMNMKIYGIKKCYINLSIDLSACNHQLLKSESKVCKSKYAKRINL